MIYVLLLVMYLIVQLLYHSRIANTDEYDKVSCRVLHWFRTPHTNSA